MADRGGAILSKAGGTTRLTNVTLTNSTATGDEADAGGGAIFTAVGNLFATGLVATGNSASGTSGSGGVVFQASGSIVLVDATLEGNSANRAGGGIEIVDGSFFARNITLGSEGMGNSTGLESETGPGNGGGLHITGFASANIVGGTVSGNQAAGEGGGLWNQAGSRLFVSGVTIDGNEALGDQADQGGGGIFNNGGDLRIVGDSTISNNFALGESGSGGGVLSVDGRVFVADSNISLNTANRAGGGIEIIDGSLVVRDSAIVSNVAGPAGSGTPGNGGGFHVSGVANSRFIGAQIFDNQAASEGGGLWNQAGSDLFVFESLIDNNVALGADSDNGGGGIFNNGGTVSIFNSEISNNTADSTALLGLGEDASEAGGSGGGIFSTSGTIVVDNFHYHN